VSVSSAFSTGKPFSQSHQMAHSFPKRYSFTESKGRSSRVNALPTIAKDTALKLSGGGMVAAGAATTASGGALGAINTFFISFPIISSMLVCGLKAGVADSLAQRRDTGSNKFCFRRNIAYIVYSSIFLGLTCELNYNRLYPVMFGSSTGIMTLIGMVAFDMLVSSLLIYLPALYFVKALFFRQTFRSAAKKFVNDVRYKGLLFTYWKIWVPVQFLTFSIIPDHLKVSFIASVSFFWMILLSCIESNKTKNKKGSTDEGEKKKIDMAYAS